jgi:hypothetical protein
MAGKLSSDERFTQLERVVHFLLLFIDSEMRQAAGLTLDEVRKGLRQSAGLEAPPPLTRREREEGALVQRELMARAEAVVKIGRQLRELQK